MHNQSSIFDAPQQKSSKKQLNGRMTPLKKKKDLNSSKRNLKSPPEASRTSITLLPQIKTRNSNLTSKKNNKKEKATSFIAEQTSDAELLRRCSSSQAILETLQSDAEQIECQQNEFFERLPSGDYVIYDSRCRIMTFKNKSMQVVEVFIYQDLDFQEFKKQMEAQKNVPMVGCNEIKYRDNTGKICFK